MGVVGHSLDGGLPAWRRHQPGHEVSNLLFCALVDLRSHQLLGQMRAILVPSLSALAKRFHVRCLVGIVGVSRGVGWQGEVELGLLVEVVLDNV